MSSAEIIQKIVRYRQFLERALGKREDQQVLIILEKLDRLPISLDHLQETGVGKTVNCYRKCSDPVGMKAKSIVNKWKGLVQAAIAEDQSQRSDNSPVQTDDDESEHLSHSNATDDEKISTHDSFDNDSSVIHEKKERSANRGPSEMEAYSSKVKRKFESSRVEKPPKKPYDNSGRLERHGRDRSAKTDSREMAHQLKESLPCNGSSKDEKCSDISNKAVSHQSHLNSSGKSQVSTHRDSSRGSDHSSSHRGHKRESQRSGSSSHSNRDVSHRHRSKETDRKSSTAVSGHDSLRKSTNVVSDSESLSQNRTIVEEQSSERNRGSGDVSGNNPRHFDLSNNLKRGTNDSSYGDIPQKKQLLESERTAIITDLHDGSSPQDHGRSAPAKQSGHRDHSFHKNSSSKTNSSSHKDPALPKEDSAAHMSKEKSSSESKSSRDKSSASREASSSRESLSGRLQSHKESASKNSSQKESSAKASSHTESSGKHVSHKDSGSRISSVKESFSKHSSQKQSSSLPSVFKESPRKVSNEKVTSFEESFSESFPDDTVAKPSSLGKLAGSSVRDSPRSVDGSSRSEMGLTEAKSKRAAVTFSALNSDAEEDSCGMSFEEMLSYDIASSKLGSATKPVPRKTAADMSKVLKKDDGRFAKGYSGSPSSVLSDSNKPINEKNSVGRKVSQAAEYSSKKTDHSSKYEDGSRVSRKDSSKVNSSHHYKLESSSSSTKQDKSGSSHSKSSEGSSSKERIQSSGTVQKSENVVNKEHSKSSSSKSKSESHSSKESSKSNSGHSKSVSSSSKEHSIYSSSHSKSESKSSKELSKSSSSFHQTLESSSIKEATNSGSSSRRPECSKTSSGDDSRDKNFQIAQPKKETKELGYKSGSLIAKGIRNLVDESDADSEDIDSNGKSFEDFLNYKPSGSQNKSLAKSSKLYSAGSSKNKLERKPLGYTIDDDDGFSVSHPLVNVPLPKQEELNLSLDSDSLPLYPSMQQEFRVNKESVEKQANLERRYNQKMIYSGKRQATVPTAMTSLFAACMQVLQENIDDITFVGGIPADILKPVLDLCSVSQLERLEFYNPQFVGDTEDLWKLHCNRDFRGRDHEELESWRELYLRLQDARNKRLATISQSVMANKKRAEKEVPRIQLTYVDHVVTGRRTSKKFAAVRNSSAATASDETSQPRSKQEILDSLKSQVSKPMIRRRGGGYRPEVTSISKPAAPLMQKTLKFLKGMKR